MIFTFCSPFVCSVLSSLMKPRRPSGHQHKTSGSFLSFHFTRLFVPLPVCHSFLGLSALHSASSSSKAAASILYYELPRCSASTTWREAESGESSRCTPDNELCYTGSYTSFHSGIRSDSVLCKVQGYGRRCYTR